MGVTSQIKLQDSLKLPFKQTPTCVAFFTAGFPTSKCTPQPRTPISEAPFAQNQKPSQPLAPPGAASSRAAAACQDSGPRSPPRSSRPDHLQEWVSMEVETGRWEDHDPLQKGLRVNWGSVSGQSWCFHHERAVLLHNAEPIISAASE